MPSDSPSAPIKRTSFALISSLSRFSLSFALIVQHLQKNNRTKTLVSARSPKDPKDGKSTKMEPINQQHNRCAGENGAFFFVLLEYYTTLFPSCQVFFWIFFIFFTKITTTFLSIVKCTKKVRLSMVKFLLCTFFTNVCVNFRHNWIFTNRFFCGIILCADGQSSVGFPFFAHLFLLREMSISWHPYAPAFVGVQFLLKSPLHGATYIL